MAARALKASLVTDVGRGEYRAETNVTFETYAREWADTYQGRTARGIRRLTLDEYRATLERHAIPYFGSQRLTRIDPPALRAFVKHLQEKGLDPNTVRNAVSPVRAMFATAFGDGAIRSNPTAGLVLAKGAGQKPVKFLNRVQLDALIDEIEPKWRLFVRFLASTGLRISEAVALRWEHVDLRAGEVVVRERRRGSDVDEPKSAYGKRDIPLAPGLARQLREWRAASPRSRDADPVFPSQAGTPLMPGNLARRVLKPAAERAGVPWVTWHVLRHTAASIMFENGLDAKEVQAVLGHHAASFTIDTYVHRRERVDLGFMDQAVGGGQGGYKVATPPAEAGRKRRRRARADSAV
jgi:integrase